MKQPIELNKFQEDILSSERFLKLNEQEMSNISYTEIVPPKLGKRDFGGIKVYYKNPVFMRFK